MTDASIQPRLIHEIPGRVRLHLEGWSGKEREQIEKRLCQIEGVRSAQGDTLTGNVLVHFDSHTVSTTTLLAAFEKPMPTEQMSNQFSHPTNRPKGTQVFWENWWEWAQVCLLLAELVTGVFVLEEIEFFIGGLKIALHLGDLLLAFFNEEAWQRDRWSWRMV